MDKQKAKKNYLSKLKRIVSSHVYDLGKRVVDEAESSAEDNHELKLGIHKSKDDIVKEVVDLNRKVKTYIKATKDEVVDVLKQGSQQAITALKNEGGSDENDEDEFFKSLGLDEDDLDDIVNGEDDEEPSMEGLISHEDRFDNVLSIKRISNSDLTAAALLLVRTCNDDEISGIVNENLEEIRNLLENPNYGVADEISQGDQSKVNLVDQFMDNIENEIAPSISNEDVEEAGLVVEVVETELPTVPVRTAVEDLTLKSRYFEVLKKFLNQCKLSVYRDDELMAIAALFDGKLEAVARFIAAKLGLEDHIPLMRKLTYPITCNGILDAVDYQTAYIFYLNLIPEEIMTEGRRLIKIYNKIKEDK